MKKIAVLCLVLSSFLIAYSLVAKDNRRPPAVSNNIQDIFVKLSKKLVPSVVNIYTSQVVQQMNGQQVLVLL